MELTIPEFYATVKGALVSDPDFEEAMLRDVDAALAGRYGVALPRPGRLMRDGEGYALTVGDQTFAIGDPRRAVSGELDDAELELVSGGKGGGASDSSSQSQNSGGNTTFGVNTINPGTSVYIQQGSTSLILK